MSRKGQSPWLPGSKPHLDEAKIVALRNEGMTHKALAVRFGTNLDRIGKILRKHGLGRRQGDKEL